MISGGAISSCFILYHLVEKSKIENRCSITKYIFSTLNDSIATLSVLTSVVFVSNSIFFEQVFFFFFFSLSQNCHWLIGMNRIQTWTLIPTRWSTSPNLRISKYPPPQQRMWSAIIVEVVFSSCIIKFVVWYGVLTTKVVLATVRHYGLNRESLLVLLTVAVIRDKSYFVR